MVVPLYDGGHMGMAFEKVKSAVCAFADFMGMLCSALPVAACY